MKRQGQRRTHSVRFFGIILPACLCLSLSPSLLQAELPATQLGSVFPAGANPGATVEVEIGGSNLDGADRLVFSHAGIKAEQKMREPNQFEEGPQPVPRTFAVTVAGNVPPGRYDVRAVGKYGMSNPRVFTVGRLAERIEEEPNNGRDEAAEVELPAVLNGRADSAADVDFYSFAAKKGQRILAACQAWRIDSRMDAVLTVYDATGRELAAGRNTHRRDPLVDFTAPADGVYYLRIADSVYRGSADYFYRVRVGVLPHIDFVFPPALANGSGTLALFGRNLPGAQDAGLQVDGRPLAKRQVSVNLASPTGVPNCLIAAESAGLDLREYRIEGSQGFSAPVMIGIATAPPVPEKEANDTPGESQRLEVPCEVQGQFYPRGDRDWFEFEAAGGDVYTVEVISQRLGLPTDPRLIIQQVTTVTRKAEDGSEVTEEQSKTVASSDDSGNRAGAPAFDTRTDDPSVRFTVPADGKYRVLLADAISALRDDPRHVYRFAVRKGNPGFHLVAAPDHPIGSLTLRKGGRQAIRVVAFRRDGYDGEIRLAAEGLPAGVSCPEVVIGPGSSSVSLVLTADSAAAPATGLVKVTGTATIDGKQVTRPAGFGTLVWPYQAPQNNQPQPQNRSRLARGLAVSISDEAAPAVVSVGANKVYELPRAGNLKIPYQRSGFGGKLTARGVGLPANIEVNNRKAINLNSKGGSFELKIANNAPVGAHSFHLSGTAEKLKYRHNPEAAERAAQQKQAADKIAAEAAAAAKAAANALSEADKAAQQAAAARKAAQDKKAAADDTLAKAESQAQQAAEQLEAAKTALAGEPGNESLAANVKNAEKAVSDAAANVKVAKQAVAETQKAVEGAQSKADAAAKAKAEAQSKSEAADARAKAAEEFKQQAENRAKQLAERAKEKQLNVTVVSNPVTIKVTPAPVTLSLSSPPAALKQGAKLEVPVNIKRLYNYAEAVTVTAKPPQGVSGLSIPNATIAKGQSQTKLVLAAADSATPGEHELQVQASMKLNGQTVSLTDKLTVKIEKVERPAEKKAK